MYVGCSGPMFANLINLAELVKKKAPHPTKRGQVHKISAQIQNVSRRQQQHAQMKRRLTWSVHPHGPYTTPAQPSRERRISRGYGRRSSIVPGWLWLSATGVGGAMAALLGPLARVLEGVHDLGLGRSLLDLVVVLPARGLGKRHEDALDAPACTGE